MIHQSIRLLVAVFSLFICASSSAQLEKGFNATEAKDMLAICNSFAFIDLYKSDKEILPEGYKKIYTSGTFGMENKFQIYRKGNTAVFNFRGTTTQTMSWMENIHAAMIPAKGDMLINGEKISYAFAHHDSAAVHSGYALAIAFLAKDIEYHLYNLHQQGVHDIIITGHSQGGALAQMLKAYVENNRGENISEDFFFKTYSFANPKCGNKEFALEYNERFQDDESSFSIINPADPIPRMPLSYNEGSFISGDDISAFLFDGESLNMKERFTDLLIRKNEKGLSRHISKTSNRLAGLMAKQLGDVSLPPFVDDINYYETSVVVTIPPVEYPKMLRDSTILQNDSIMKANPRGPDGHFENLDLYVKEPMMFQHKPYNYYASFLMVFFSDEFAALEPKCQVE